MKRLLAILLFAATASADTFTFTVVGMDCAACGPPIVKTLESVDGVKNAKVDWKSKSATVELPSTFDKQKIRTALTNAGFESIFPGEERREIQPLPADVVKSLDIIEYNEGKRVDIPSLMASGKVTIVDFYGAWCGPCRVLETRLQHLMRGKSNLAVRRVDIGKWDNEAAKQATREFHAEALPYIRVYDARGKFVGSVTGGMWDEVLAMLAKAEIKAEK
ncbi:MAG TPA: thioredoxin domain-containing protein [Thermoanaerobaculia bacterium]|nr:thioredoxin domain-containing protein [Thermoanaerobaculia bacterium]